MNEQIAFVKEIARRLDSAGIFYMFTGSIAMVFYATPRMTRDIDSYGMFHIISNALILKADFIVRKNDEYRRLEFPGAGPKHSTAALFSWFRPRI